MIPITALAPFERRVLGVLIEKQKTSKSPDAYPMTLNSIVVGCNQKSNRDPVYDLTDDDVEETLSALQKQGLVMRMTGGRTDRFRHLLYEAWSLNKVEMAIVAELLLRGPQSVGDLRGRASRMDDIADLDTLKTLLKPLAERNLVLWLTDAERRGAMITHGFHSAEELTAAKMHAAGVADMPEVVHAPVASGGLSTRVDALEKDIATLKAELSAIKSQLGIG